MSLAVFFPILIGAIILTALISSFAALNYHKKVSEAKIGSAEDKAREILDEALKTADQEEGSAA